jgi:hypothetical protein
MTQNQLPAYLQQYQAPDIASSLSANLGSAMPPHVSIGGGRFTLIDAGNNEIPVPTFNPQLGVYLDACIMDVNDNISRIYFVGSYDPNQEGVRPDCFSDNGIAPSISASSPQANSCMADPTGVNGCKWAVWGSKINANGKGVPACSSKQKVALLVPGFQTLFLLAVPPNSHGPLREYTEKCKGHGINMANLITRISFVPGVQGTLQFQAVGYIDEPTAKLRQAAYAEKKTDALVGRTDMPRPIGTIASVQIAAPVTAVNVTSGGGGMQPYTTQPQIVQQPARQEQQPAPFVPTPAANAAPSGQWPQNPAQPAATTSPSEPAPQQRRRRRTAAEMQAAQPNGQAPQQPAGTPQAPFPHPPSPAAMPGVASQQDFGIAQPAQADPALGQMLDDFFGKS